MSLPWGQHQRKVHLQMLVTVNAQINRMYPVLVSGFFFFPFKFSINLLYHLYTAFAQRSCLLSEKHFIFQI